MNIGESAAAAIYFNLLKSIALNLLYKFLIFYDEELLFRHFFLIKLILLLLFYILYISQIYIL